MNPMSRLKLVAILLFLGLVALTSKACIILVIDEALLAAAAGATVAVPP